MNPPRIDMLIEILGPSKNSEYIYSFFNKNNIRIIRFSLKINEKEKE